MGPSLRLMDPLSEPFATSQERVNRLKNSSMNLSIAANLSIGELAATRSLGTPVAGIFG